MTLFSDLKESKNSFWTRRKLLISGLSGIGAASAAIAVSYQKRRSSLAVKIPPLPEKAEVAEGFNPITVLRDFNYGTLKRENGKTVREFEVVAKSSTLQLNSAISFVSWNLNGRVPGPTLRAIEGERVRIIFHNQDGHSHSIHFHGIHPEDMDGVKPVRHGKSTIYEFNVSPYGLYPYHCHIAPVTRHISKGLYGLLIVDPKKGRPPADEMVMVMGAYDINNDEQNELYAFNGIPNYYRDHPIPIYQNQLIRLYVLNMVEYNPALTFHIHANLFRVYRSGRTLTPNEETDVITMGTAERHILEFSYPYTGRYMFHPHQDFAAELGCMGFFNVLPT
ncbi:multicopper oxidase domain-containing protein [Gloeothece verrucosa]|uniref:Multicopper oxidase type 3 n=1 Tax=Gloeothece verrucosa (strain PCC 7822) TaxID=497965 RepID=E0UEI6_GLOV7|nr:multicopper oxidase domain-containing protein [Gloeothece verrucosa]ADN15432.1 multicopper oxidase type 3 [Gloeothece verrucosa PCC 7822]